MNFCILELFLKFRTQLLYYIIFVDLQTFPRNFVVVHCTQFFTSLKEGELTPYDVMIRA